MATASTSDKEKCPRAQDLKRCNLCTGKDRKSHAELACNTCNIELCKHCVGQHISEDAFSKHVIVPLKSKTITLCKRHQHDKCEFYCSQCDMSFCLQCILSGSHREHNIRRIEEVCKSKREELRKHIKEIDEVVEPQYSTVLSEIDNLLSNVKKNHADRKNVILTLEEKLHNLVNKIIEKYQGTAAEHETQDITFIESLKSTIEDRQQIQAAKQECFQMLAAEDSTTLIAFKFAELKLPKNQYKLEKNVIVSSFHPKQVTEEQLTNLIGNLNPSIREDMKKQDELVEKSKVDPESSVLHRVKFFQQKQ